MRTRHNVMLHVQCLSLSFLRARTLAKQSAKGTRILERVERIGRGGIFLRRDGMRTPECVGRIGRVGIFVLIKHNAWYFRGRAEGIQLTAGH
jgi:hypothetical protein